MAQPVVYTPLNADYNAAAIIPSSMPAPTKQQTVVNFCTNVLGVDVPSSGYLFYRVTAGKRLFITSLTMTLQTGSGATWQLNDAIAGADGDKKLTGGMAPSVSLSFTFPTPLQFTIGFNLLSLVTQRISVCFSGWEEPL